ncbi:MAG: rRNA maturation RNase YbeY [Lachnospiraceae bacterium]|nr:rRNA maturation RNase YbeY [Lachnospiraceae bacterium]
MTLLMQKENDSLDGIIDVEKEAKNIIDFVIDHMKCPYEAEVNLTITDNEEIRRVNKEFRGIDKATDVLSFPMVDYEEPFDFSAAEASPGDYFNPDSGELLLGDIMISAEKVLEQAELYGHSPKREYCFLIVHSMLHLFGYDHIEDEDRVIMEGLQNEIMEAAGISR